MDNDRIRRARPADIPRLGALLGEVLEVHALARPDIFISGTRKYSDQELEALLEDRDRPVFVFENADGLVIGYAFCILEATRGARNLWDMLTLYVDDICVDSRFRRQGVARALYEHVGNFAREMGCQRLTLNVWEGNQSARAFYEAMGMKPLKTTLEQVL